MKRCLIFTLFALFSCGFSLAQTASVPQLINYQGKLTDAGGNAVATADYTLSISVYDNSLGGNRLWGPQLFDGQTGAGHGPKIPVVKGYFNVILGPTDVNNKPITEAFVSSKSFIEVAINGSEPVKPRQMILSAPYALKANFAYSASEALRITGPGNWAKFPFGRLDGNGERGDRTCAVKITTTGRPVLLCTNSNMWNLYGSWCSFNRDGVELCRFDLNWESGGWPPFNLTYIDTDAPPGLHTYSLLISFVTERGGIHANSAQLVAVEL